MAPFDMEKLPAYQTLLTGLSCRHGPNVTCTTHRFTNVCRGCRGQDRFSAMACMGGIESCRLADDGQGCGSREICRLARLAGNVWGRSLVETTLGEVKAAVDAEKPASRPVSPAPAFGPEFGRYLDEKIAQAARHMAEVRERTLAKQLIMTDTLPGGDVEALLAVRVFGHVKAMEFISVLQRRPRPPIAFSRYVPEGRLWTYRPHRPTMPGHEPLPWWPTDADKPRVICNPRTLTPDLIGTLRRLGLWTAEDERAYSEVGRVQGEDKKEG